ncbi:hypothetical protein [Conexibacter woesei]|uniref:DUF4142 domain-containing protein n=1 Tax=Conexibacter woesei (strain DSM 14684 / CCUG 47730 / CIP 108061 / JCM 11494 / NBRC 100937 / ID131577) TaxID=469383 RepID=D3EZX0_CONWI|nr:hypothetical protein [Conexibacter woesei]ADB49946.1 hypothetical protein Cwoe_1518 [Conexibacter woesei DSM 14684]
MTSIARRRLPLLLTALLTLLLVAPVAARADDQSFARTALTHADALKRAETAATRALRRVDARGRSAIPGARQAVKTVRGQARLMRDAVDREQTSTPDGETTKRQLLELLAVELRAYGTLDRALAAYKRGDVRTANTLLRRAKGQLRGVGEAAARVGQKLSELAA